MPHKGWYDALANALKTEQMEDCAVMQVATIDEPSGTPHVRTQIQRGFITASTLPNLPLILSTTDVRTPKVIQLAGSRASVEVVFWTPSTQEQFRILGRVSIVPASSYQGAYPVPRGIVYEELYKEGFDWEAKRVEMFDRMSDRLRAAWCRPTPGTRLIDEEEMKAWPEKLPKLDEAENEGDKKNVATALSHFALFLIEPFEVDYLELGLFPNRRTLFKRGWGNENSVDFGATLVVP